MTEKRLYRAVLDQYCSSPLLSRSEKGRFHRGLNKPTVYLAEQWETAWHEVTFRWNADPSRYKKVHVSANISNIVDLTDETVRSQYGISKTELVSDDYTACQALAARLRADGVEAIRTFSRADINGRVLVVFLECLKSNSQITVDHVESVVGP